MPIKFVGDDGEAGADGRDGSDGETQVCQYLIFNGCFQVNKAATAKFCRVRSPTSHASFARPA